MIDIHCNLLKGGVIGDKRLGRGTANVGIRMGVEGDEDQEVGNCHRIVSIFLLTKITVKYFCI